MEVKYHFMNIMILCDKENKMRCGRKPETLHPTLI